ncbi:uncharacterized protein LOC128932451 [Callithrix jacchus]
MASPLSPVCARGGREGAPLYHRSRRGWQKGARVPALREALRIRALRAGGRAACFCRWVLSNPYRLTREKLRASSTGEKNSSAGTTLEAEEPAACPRWGRPARRAALTPDPGLRETAPWLPRGPGQPGTRTQDLGRDARASPRHPHTPRGSRAHVTCGPRPRPPVWAAALRHECFRLRGRHEPAAPLRQEAELPATTSGATGEGGASGSRLPAGARWPHWFPRPHLHFRLPCRAGRWRVPAWTSRVTGCRGAGCAVVSPHKKPRSRKARCLGQQPGSVRSGLPAATDGAWLLPDVGGAPAGGTRAWARLAGSRQVPPEPLAAPGGWIRRRGEW